MFNLVDTLAVFLLLLFYTLASRRCSVERQVPLMPMPSYRFHKLLQRKGCGHVLERTSMDFPISMLGTRGKVSEANARWNGMARSRATWLGVFLFSGRAISRRPPSIIQDVLSHQTHVCIWSGLLSWVQSEFRLSGCPSGIGKVQMDAVG